MLWCSRELTRGHPAHPCQVAALYGTGIRPQAKLRTAKRTTLENLINRGVLEPQRTPHIGGLLPNPASSPTPLKPGRDQQRDYQEVKETFASLLLSQRPQKEQFLACLCRHPAGPLTPPANTEKTLLPLPDSGVLATPPKAFPLHRLTAEQVQGVWLKCINQQSFFHFFI